MLLFRYAGVVNYVPNGAGPVSFPSAQALKFGSLEFAGLTVANPTISNPGQPTGYQQFAGGDTLTAANLALALTGLSSVPTGGMALDLYNAILSQLTRINNFGSGLD